MGPFTAYLDPGDPLRFFNYAIPENGARPARDDVGALRRVFRDRARLPRLEWVEEAAPAVAPALAAAGMREELRAPLMTLTEAELVDAAADVEGLTIAPVDDADVAACVDVQRRAFGDSPLADGEERPDPRRHGGGAVLARAAGEPVAAAGWTRVVDATAEVAGVATAEAWRRRGLAGAVTAAAAREAFRAGATRCVLSPGDEGAQRVYERAGFRRVATMLHWSDPE